MSISTKQSTLTIDSRIVIDDVTVSSEQQLRAADRCDRCGAQAFVHATNVDSGLDLLFCGHHGRNAITKLVADGWKVVDYTPSINLEASVSANKD